MRGEIPGEQRRTYSGTKLETADTAKESLKLTGSPLLGGLFNAFEILDHTRWTDTPSDGYDSGCVPNTKCVAGVSSGSRTPTYTMCWDWSG